MPALWASVCATALNAPNGVAEYTVMAILMCIRKFKKALYNTNDNDFTLKGKMGRELRTMTVGVMGTGKIGYTVIKCLSGFGCRILANDVYQNDAVRQYAEYVDLDTLYRESDIITIHTPLLPETTGMINREALAKMKDGVVLIDNARGERWTLTPSSRAWRPRRSALCLWTPSPARPASSTFPTTTILSRPPACPTSS